MIVTADKSSDPNALSIASDTVGIIFLGTPHRGSPSASFGSLIARTGKLLGLSTEERILNAIEEESKTLK